MSEKDMLEKAWPLLDYLADLAQSGIASNCGWASDKESKAIAAAYALADDIKNKLDLCQEL